MCRIRILLTFLSFFTMVVIRATGAGRQGVTVDRERAITEADCTPGKVGTGISASLIGEPVSGVTLSAPRWVAAAATVSAYCSVDGSMAPVDRGATAKPILFRVVLPAAWKSQPAIHRYNLNQ